MGEPADHTPATDATTTSAKDVDENVVEMRDVRKSFGSMEVLRGIDLSVPPRETVVLIGRSGTGKSVTLRHIVGLNLPDSGTVRVFGQEVARLRKKGLPKLRQRMGRFPALICPANARWTKSWSAFWSSRACKIY